MKSESQPTIAPHSGRLEEPVERIGSEVDKQMRPGNWRSMVLEAAIRQGPSFVILLLLLFALWNFSNFVVQEGVPAHLQQIQLGYEKIQQSHSQEIDRLVIAFEREQLLIRDTHALLNEAIGELMRNRSLSAH